MDDYAVYKGRGLTADEVAYLWTEGTNGIAHSGTARIGGPMAVQSITWPWAQGYSVSNVLAFLAVTNTSASDVIFEASCNGTNWTTIPLTGTNSMPLSHDGDTIYTWTGTGTCAAAGTNVKIRVSNTNNARSRIYGTGLAVQ